MDACEDHAIRFHDDIQQWIKTSRRKGEAPEMKTTSRVSSKPTPIIAAGVKWWRTPKDWKSDPDVTDEFRRARQRIFDWARAHQWDVPENAVYVSHALGEAYTQAQLNERKG